MKERCRYTDRSSNGLVCKEKFREVVDVRKSRELGCVPCVFSPLTSRGSLSFPPAVLPPECSQRSSATPKADETQENERFMRGHARQDMFLNPRSLGSLQPSEGKAGPTRPFVYDSGSSERIRVRLTFRRLEGAMGMPLFRRERRPYEKRFARVFPVELHALLLP